MRFYAVRMGRATGIFYDSETARKQTIYFTDADCRMFTSMADAKAYLNKKRYSKNKKNVYNLYVDGSYSPEKHIYGWGIAVYNRKQLIYTYKGIGVRGIAIKNIAGEIRAATEAIKWAIEKNRKINLYYDFDGISKFTKKNTKLSNAYILEYAYFVQANKNKVRFHKVKAHSGIEGNSMAHRLAREAVAAYENKYPANYGLIPGSVYAELIREQKCRKLIYGEENFYDA